MKKTLLTILTTFLLSGLVKADEVWMDKWDVEIINQSTNEVVKSETVSTNAFLLDGLEQNTEYVARVRTRNQMLSGWVMSDVFMFDSTTKLSYPDNESIRFWLVNETLFISSPVEKQLNIYSIDGRMVHSVLTSTTITRVEGLKKGVYLINNQKVIIK